MTLEIDREAALRDFARHPLLAHRILFRHRHGDETAPMHKRIMGLLHGRAELISIVAFRGSAKSTYAEEAVLLQAAFQLFRHALFVGGNADLAAQRVHAIRHEIETNEAVAELFGDLRGSGYWSDDRLELANGVIIRALGRGQQLRGNKEIADRPDFLVLDDIEDRDSVRTPKSRDDTEHWLMREVMPSLAPGSRVCALSNILDPDCLPIRLQRHGSGWTTSTYPIEYRDQDGVARASWPARFPLDAVAKLRERYRAQGRADIFEMEYMCRAQSDAAKPFRREMFRTEARARSWQTVQGWFDPARTVRETSADTGFASWSWIGSQLTIWEAWGKKLLPNEIVAEIFAYNDRARPAVIGLDEIGLSEFLLQPLRAEQVRRGILLPLKTLPAPKSKTEQIRALQPFLANREVVFAQPLPDLESQLLNFPSGLRDILDALSNALRLRGGVPVYEEFGARHLGPGLKPVGAEALFLALDATQSLCAAILLASRDGAVRVYRDWLREGEPADRAEGLLRDAVLVAGDVVPVYVPPHHFDRYHNVGLVQALRRAGVEALPGAAGDRGAVELRRLLKATARGLPAFQVSDAASWTANALAGGYARAVLPNGMLAPEPEPGPYPLVMAALEAFLGLSALGLVAADDDGATRYAEARDGRLYASALPSARPRALELKR